ncbi:MAG: RNA 2',3'-cyclic phosphodiesterase [Chloroflexi bacterium]|nr:RNA 2',3'-cyclic phosphodiesterase [Chloroflexota bacterium]
MSTVRTFIAAELGKGLMQEIGRVQGLLRAAPGGRAVTWVRPEGIHLTFKFLGDTDEKRLPDVYEAVQHIGSTHPAFTIAVSGLGCFPRVTRPRVVWLGLQDEKHQAQRLQQALDAELASIGFVREDRPFQPHLTLGRVRSSALSSEIEAVGRTAADQQVGQLGILMVDHLCVITSTLTPSGAVYHILYQANLQPD